MGKAYQYGGSGPDAFDCSGLIQHAYAAAGISLPRSSQAQSEIGVPVAVPDLQPGDLPFYYSPVGHVGMYIGEGKIVHSGTEATGVEITYGAMDGFHSARRVA